MQTTAAPKTAAPTTAEVRFTLPGNITECVGNTVTLQVPCDLGPIFHSLALTTLTQGMSDTEADRFLIDMEEYVACESIKRRVIVHVKR